MFASSDEMGEPYEQRWVMHSVDPSTLVKVGIGTERCALCQGLQSAASQSSSPTSRFHSGRSSETMST